MIESIRDWGIWDEGHLLRTLVAIGFLILLALAFQLFVSKVLSRALSRAIKMRGEDRDLIRRRTNTLATTLNWAFRLILFFIGAGLILSEFGLNVSALVASVGIVGIALGLGAQTLVRDVLNGMFILIEDQYAVGDTVTVAGVTGEVIEINPRRTVLRDDDGNVHSIPNSTITVATNRTMGLNRFVVDVVVPFRESDRAAELVWKVCTEITEAQRNSLVTTVRLVDQRALPDGQVGLKISGDARPPHRWAVEADLRRRLKRAFEAERLEMEMSGAEAAR